MKGRRAPVALAVALVIFALAGMSGCGGGSSSTATTGTAPSANSSSSDAAEPSAEFAGKGRNGELAAAGRESSVADREAASQVVEQAFGARSARNWAAQCDVLTSTLREQLERAAPKAPHGQACDRRLAALAQKAAPAALEDSMTEPLAALRVNGPQAFAFFHGKGGRDYVIPMQKEHGEWKVAALSAQEAP